MLKKVRYLLAAAVLGLAVTGSPRAQAAEANSVTAADQTVAGGLVVVPQVVAAEPGFMAIHATSEGFPVVGVAYFPAGTTDNLVVHIDVSKATSDLLAMLHVDKGEAGVYEFPGADVPVNGADGKPIAPSFKIIGVHVDDQFVDKDGMLTVGTVVAQEDGFIVIHSGAEKFPAIGQAPIKKGVNKDVKVKLDDPSKATPRMTAMIHVDKGEVGKYEFPGADVPANIAAKDTPAALGGGISNEPFWSVDTVRVMAQILGDGDEVTIPSILAKENGYLVIHATSEGLPGIGNAPVKAGLNKDVKVKVDKARVTPTVLAMLHVDKGEAGKYEFPGPDVPVNNAEGKPIAPPVAISDAVMVSDQPSGALEINQFVVIDGVNASANGFLVVHATSEGFPGIGAQFVHRGYNPRVIVKIDISKSTPKLLGMLHVDKGTAGKYEFPGADVPVNGADGKPIAPEFNLTK